MTWSLKSSVAERCQLESQFTLKPKMCLWIRRDSVEVRALALGPKIVLRLLRHVMHSVNRHGHPHLYGFTMVHGSFPAFEARRLKASHNRTIKPHKCFSTWTEQVYLENTKGTEPHSWLEKLCHDLHGTGFTWNLPSSQGTKVVSQGLWDFPKQRHYAFLKVVQQTC